MGSRSCAAFQGDDRPGTLRDAVRHLGEGVALAHLVGRPHLEVSGLTHLAMVTGLQSAALGVEQGLMAVELAPPARLGR